MSLIIEMGRFVCRIINYLGNFQYPLSWELENENTFHTVTGPGAYNITGMGSDSMRRAYIESTRKGVFGTTSVRVQAITRKEETEQPGPAHYQVKEKPYKTRYPNLTSTFASVTSRLTEQAPIVKVSEFTSECLTRNRNVGLPLDHTRGLFNGLS